MGKYGSQGKYGEVWGSREVKASQGKHGEVGKSREVKGSLG